MSTTPQQLDLPVWTQVDFTPCTLPPTGGNPTSPAVVATLTADTGQHLTVVLPVLDVDIVGRLDRAIRQAHRLTARAGDLTRLAAGAPPDPDPDRP